MSTRGGKVTWSEEPSVHLFEDEVNGQAAQAAQWSGDDCEIRGRDLGDLEKNHRCIEKSRGAVQQRVGEGKQNVMGSLIGRPDSVRCRCQDTLLSFRPPSSICFPSCFAHSWPIIEIHRSPPTPRSTSSLDSVQLWCARYDSSQLKLADLVRNILEGMSTRRSVWVWWATCLRSCYIEPHLVRTLSTNGALNR